jgi:hypothetical protein
MSDSIGINGVEYNGKMTKCGTRNFHPQSEYVGKRVIDVAKEPSDDAWTCWYVFESSKPLPVNQDLSDPYPRLEYASWMDVSRDDCEAPGQLFRRRAYIARMTPCRVLITQSGGRDI